MISLSLAGNVLQIGDVAEIEAEKLSVSTEVKLKN